MKLIDIDVIIAEIQRRIDELEPFATKDNLRAHGAIAGYYNILSFLHTIEIKEVDWKEERMKECAFRQVVCKMYNGTILECKGACSWVVDYPKLKELETKKGQ